MTAAILKGTFAQVLAAMLQAPRGITVKRWIELNKGDKCTT